MHASEHASNARAALESMKRNGVSEDKQIRYMENLLLAVEALASKETAEPKSRKRETVTA